MFLDRKRLEKGTELLGAAVCCSCSFDFPCFAGVGGDEAGCLLDKDGD